MNTHLSVLIALGAAVASWWLTGRFRRYALAHQLFDIPNARSSHAVAIPRGGGVAVVASTLLAFSVLAIAGLLARPIAYGLVVGGALVAMIGLADDYRDVSPQWRLLVHVVAVGWVVAWMGPLPSLTILGIVLAQAWLTTVITGLYLVWLVNLTNFMDGVDGIAGVEAITVSAGGVLLYLVAAPDRTLWVTPLVVASATVGFLVWNWPPAKIFLGDVGSGFLGLMLGGLSLQAASVSPTLFWSWAVLLGAFVVDATVTLLRRAVNGERFYEAHRSHAYQHAASRYGAHLPVTLAFAAINVCWLLPIALLVARGTLDGSTGVLSAYGPLVVGALWLGAGTPAQPRQP